MFLFIYLFILFIFFYPSPASTDPEWNEIVFSPAIPGLHGYQSEMEKYTHTHTHRVMKMRERWERKAWRGGRWEDGRVEIFQQPGMINISLFFILLERLRNNFLLAFTQAGIKKKRKTSFSPILSHSGFIFTFPHRWPLATMIVSYYH